MKSIILKKSIFKDLANKYLSKRVISIIWKLISFFYRNKSVKMKESTRNELYDYYKDDIIRLSKLINRDLSLWLK